MNYDDVYDPESDYYASQTPNSGAPQSPAAPQGNPLDWDSGRQPPQQGGAPNQNSNFAKMAMQHAGSRVQPAPPLVPSGQDDPQSPLMKAEVEKAKQSQGGASSGDIMSILSMLA